jgi:hypothetical protein
MTDESETPPHGGKAGVLDALEGLPDAELREVVKRGQAILAARDQERRREAVREIERLAREHGLKVDIDGHKRRRGRPPKEAG